VTELSKDGEVMREITSLDVGISPTAASAFNPLYASSGVMKYRCVLKDGSFIDVDAATGDDAAAKAISARGLFVQSVNPAPKY